MRFFLVKIDNTLKRNKSLVGVDNDLHFNFAAAVYLNTFLKVSVTAQLICNVIPYIWT